jgi:integrase/recombinase XerD
MKNIYQWKSDLSTLLQGYLIEKQMTGFKFKNQGRELERFDEYYYRNGYAGIRLTKSMADGFIYGNDYEKSSTLYTKEILLNSFAEFLTRQGYTVFVPLIKSAPKKRCQHVPYIFSNEELKRFFLAIDDYPRTTNTNRNTIDPVLFRLLYGSGLRVSEALNLQCKDIDLESGTITILRSKNNRDRLVPIATSLVEKFGKLFSELHTFSEKATYFFISSTGGKIDQSTVYCRFRDYLLLAGISHTERGPRVHDLRHAFAVHCLKRWVLSGGELTTIMPYLAAYMGHADFRGTQNYLRLTSDLYPDIIRRTEAEFGFVIPEGGSCDERE